MATFAFVHGVCAGAWSWELVVPHIEAAGHRAIAIDLPGDDAAAKFSDYASVVESALADVSDEVVLVGHSTGGLTIPIVAAHRPVHKLVYLCSAIPVPGQSVAERGVEWRVIDPAEWQTDNGDGSFSISPDGFRRHVAPDAEPAVVEPTIPRLRRQFLTPFLERCPLESLPDVAAHSILCTEDVIVGPDYSRRATQELLGIEPVELAGSHSPMASRPRELAELLLSFA
jgi:pimeloyl-ACP methyl ester carboxylesterase